jgi:DNA polymerase-3 subunit delta
VGGDRDRNEMDARTCLREAGASLRRRQVKSGRDDFEGGKSVLRSPLMVAVKAYEVDRFIARPPEAIRLFLVYGSDAGAITERARALENYALARGRGEAVLRVGSDELSTEPGRIVDEANSASLFGGEPVVSLRVLDGRHNVIGALQPLLDRAPEAGWVIVEAAELSPTSPLRKAFEVSRRAVALPTYTIEGEDLPRFIAAAAEAAGVRIDPLALEMLTENLGGDRLAIRGELEKLFLYVGDLATITAADVQAVVGDTTAAETDATIDAALLGNHEALETGLARMRAEAGSPPSLGAATLRHLLTLQTLRAAIDAGENIESAINYARPPIFSRRRKTIAAELSRWPSRELIEARRRIDQAVYLTRLQPTLEDPAISEALHAIALMAGKLKSSGGR